MRSVVYLCLLLLTCCSGCAASESDITGETNLPDGYENRFYQGMRYGLFVPPTYDPARSYPLILSLHGSTDTTSWDLGWYHEPIQATDPVFVITPKSLVANSGWGTSWEPRHSADAQKAMDVLGLIRQQYNIDPNRIYIYGTSMGAFGTFSFLAREPDLFAGAFAICGGGNPSTAPLLKKVPLWIFHGDSDPIVPVSYSRNMYRALQVAGGYLVRYTEYAGVGHEAWEPAWKEPTLERWLLAQRKGVNHAAPAGVTGVEATIVNGLSVRVTWTGPPTDKPENEVWFYRVYRDGTLVAELPSGTAQYTETVGLPGSTHNYRIAVVNYYFGETSGPMVSLTVPGA